MNDQLPVFDPVRLLLMLFGVLCLALAASGVLLWQTINGVQQQAYETCLSRATNIARINDAARDQITIEEHNPFRLQSPETVEGRIAAWEKWIREVPVCEKP